MLSCSLVLGHESARRVERCGNNTGLENWPVSERDQANERVVEVLSARKGDGDPRINNNERLPILLSIL